MMSGFVRLNKDSVFTKPPNKRIVAAAILVSLIVVVSIYSITDLWNGNDDLLELVYDDSFLGYHSASLGVKSLPVGMSDNMTYPRIEDLTLPIVCYGSIDLDDSDIVEEIVGRFWKTADLDTMDTSLISNDGERSPYLSITNKSCEIRLLKSGAVCYAVLSDVTRGVDHIGSVENATDLAYEFLKDHGGIPTDIGRVYAGSIPTFEDGTFINGSWYVKMHRRVSSYDIYGFSLCNRIWLEFDASTKELYTMKWHWPELEIEKDLTNFPSAEEIVEHYGMNSTEEIRSNITAFEIEYFVPQSVQRNSYDTSSDTYYIPPYLKIYTDDGRSYFLGMKLP